MGHAMTPMLRLLTEPAVPDSIIEFAQLLDAYHIQTRYPNGFVSGKPADYFNQTKAEEAIRAATEIIRYCKNHLD